jgi:hypothetical protein
MKQVKYFIVLMVILQSCQLIIIEPKKTVKTNFIANQKSANGILNLFLLQLDSNDVYSAAFLQTDTSGKKELPAQQYESLFDLYRLQRQIGNLPITNLKADTLSKDSIMLYVEFDYIRNVEFLTSKIDSIWCIADKRSWKTTLY